ncbi:MAG: M3 family metallopeptidase, partial [Pseudomonas sp.]
IYTAYVTRASDQGPHDPGLDNQEVISRILTCRAELADLLGYRHYADISTARKMAGSAERVNDFLQQLAELAVPAARNEYQGLREFAERMHGITDLQAWDISYYSEKRRQQDYAISQAELRPYCPLPTVREGLFEVAGRLYGITITPNTEMETWHDTVSAWNIHRGDELLARFYLDLYTRDGKRGGAWMAECRSRRILPDGSLQTPVAYLVCNFAEGTSGDPSLLTHNEVTTLFHEFGHGLHHMLTQEVHLRSSGINGVAWDAVELPSQLMENWCWDPQSIALISAHYQTGEPLPEQLLGRLLAARNFQAGMGTVRQLEFALFDFRLHQLAGTISEAQVSETMSGVQA